MLDNVRLKNRTIVRSDFSLSVARRAVQLAYFLSDDLGTGLAERLFTTPRRFDRPGRERDLLSTAHAFTIEVARSSPRWNHRRAKVAAWRWGYGPTVLLVHGWEGRGAQLGAFVEPLVAAGLSVVTFDAPGHGDSAGNRMYLTDLADTIASVALAVGPLHGIIAHSFGAAGVVLAHARSGVDAPRNVAIAPNVVVEGTLDRFARVVGLSEGDRALLEVQIAAHAGVTIESLRIEDLTHDRDAELLVLHDHDDSEVPFDDATRLATAWPGARLRPTTGLGHRRLLRDPSVISEAVDFVKAGVTRPRSNLVREVDRLFAQG
ncbi:MAG: alpha/beta hydrolase [Kofleriaceae bacterium]